MSLRAQIIESIAGAWGRMDEDQRAWAIRRGLAVVDSVSCECTDAESWRGDWRGGEGGGSWPTYDLTLTIGADTYDIQGWHFVGTYPTDDGSRESQHGEWGAYESDGCYRGTPQALDQRNSDTHLIIVPGANLGRDTEIPYAEVGADGIVHVAPTLGEIQAAIDAAAEDADHGDDPSTDDLDEDDAEVHETRYAVRDYRGIEIDVLRCATHRNDPDSDDDDAYIVVGYTTRASDRWYDSLRELVRAEGDDWHATEEEAESALMDAAEERLAEIGAPDGLTVERDEAGVYVAGDDDDDERYHLDADDIARVCSSGRWPADVLDYISGALGLRATLAAARDWQSRMDALLTAHDPYVSLADSAAGGNCPRGTLEFARELWASMGAGECAVRASVVLALRDDPYTRRACRMAAERLCS